MDRRRREVLVTANHLPTGATARLSGRPAAGLYDPAYEHDACGVAFVADLAGRRDHDIVRKALTALRNLEHRGARGAEPDAGDGAGILIQVPDGFFREVVDFELPEAGHYAVGTAFLPDDDAAEAAARAAIEDIAREEGLTVLGWRDTPININSIGRVARASQPYIEQIFVGHEEALTSDELERKLYIVRKRAEIEVPASEGIINESLFYLPSLSSRTIVYKGLLLAPQIAKFYPELSDPEVMSALCLVHQRFSTNTFPTWQLAHPFRFVAHNGEINTVRGNVNWMHARQSILE
jgi:glutamate synthase domain-containing protein 1